MTDPRTPVFTALRTLLGGSLTPAQVTAMNACLDAMNAPREGRRAIKNAEAFYEAVRKVTGDLDQVQVDTINRLLTGAAHWPVGWLAYGLATAWHEARLKPIAEWGRGKGHTYGLPGKYGQPQYGRGLVQLTWDRNYEWVDKALGLNGSLLKNFDRALDPDIAARILIWGMETGAFTGKKLSDYISDRGTPEGFKAARRIVNGTDRADLIAGYAMKFREALDVGIWA